MKYLDTSAFVKYYSSIDVEKGSEYIFDLIESAKSGDENLLTSIITLGETLSVFDKRLRRHLITEQEFDNAVSKFFSDTNLMVNLGSLIVQLFFLV